MKSGKDFPRGREAVSGGSSHGNVTSASSYSSRHDLMPRPKVMIMNAMKKALFSVGAAALLMLPLRNATAAQPPVSATDQQTSPVEPVGTVHIEVRMATLPAKLSETLGLLFEENLETRAAEIGLRLDPLPTADVLIQVDISVSQPDAPVQIIQSVAVIDGEIVARGETQSCVRCEATELVDRGLELLPQAVEALQQRREKERAEAAAGAVEPVPEPTLDIQPEESSRVQLGPVGYVGIASTVVGLGATIAGGVFLSRGEVVEEANINVTTKDYRPAGWAMLGAGVAVMVVGNVLLGVDLGVLAHRRTGRQGARLTGLGLMVADAPGMVVIGRF